MRRLLLDTHAYLWFVNDDPRLPASVKAVLEDDEADLFLSAASAFEIAIKHGLGKLPLDVPIQTLLVETLTGFAESGPRPAPAPSPLPYSKP